MKHKLHKSTFSILILSIIAIILTASWVNNPPNYNTGAPGEFTCNVCHAADPNHPISGTLEILDLPDTILPQQTYRITIRLTALSGPAVLGGFQLTAVAQDRKQFGVLSSPGAGVGIEQERYRQYAEQQGGGIFNNNIVEWQVDWTSPQQEVTSQSFKIYASAILGNNDSTPDGDQTVITEKSYYFKSSYLPLTGGINHTDVSCSGGKDGSATVSNSGGFTPYTYYWSNGDTLAVIDSLKAGSYRVTITDSRGDSISLLTTVGEPLPVFGRIIKTDIPCNSSVESEAIVIPSSGISPYSFIWSNGDTGVVAKFNHPGKIFVTVTDANGCTFVATSNILNKDTFKLETTQIVNNKCYGGATGSATVAANIPFITSYLWSDGQIGATANNLAAGTYTVTAYSTLGCEVTNSVVIREPSPISVKTNLFINPSCAGGYNGMVSVFADGGVPPYGYKWEDGSKDKTRTNLIAGDYIVTVTDAYSCTKVDTLTLTDPDTLFLLVESVGESALHAKDGRAAALVSGGNAPYTYLWSNGSNFNTLQGLQPGYYEVTVTDFKGCKFTAATYVSPFDCELLISNVQKRHLLCNQDNNGTIELEVSGGVAPYIAKWSNGQTGLQASDLAAGDFKLSITDANGCEAIGNFTINTPPPLLKTIKITDATSEFSSDGELKVNVAGGSPPYIIEVDAVDTFKSYSGIVTFKNLFNGLHSYTITDVNGCKTSEFFIINIVGCLLKPTQVIIQDVKCKGDTTGGICLSAGNARGPVTIVWDDETNENCIVNKAKGKYSVYLSDSLGCQSLDTFSIREPQGLTVSSLHIDTPHVNLLDGSISLIISGGVQPYDIEWTKDGVPFLGPLTSLSAGKYHFKVTDDNGCVLIGDTINLVGKTSSIRKINLVSGRVYPNPANDQFYLEWPTESSIENSYLIDMQGRRIVIPFQIAEKQLVFDAKALKNGIYFIVIMTKHELVRGKVMILK